MPWIMAAYGQVLIDLMPFPGGVVHFENRKEPPAIEQYKPLGCRACGAPRRPYVYTCDYCKHTELPDTHAGFPYAGI